MICAIHQPQFIPWLGYFDKIRRADVFVFLDNVQFKKNEFQNRNRILTPDGPRWLTVPVTYRFGDPINRVRIPDDLRWRKKMVRTVQQCYGKAPGFDVCFPTFADLIMEATWASLAELNTATVVWLMDLLDVHTPTMHASDMEPLPEDATGRLVAICRKVGADVYLSGAGGRDYLDLPAFEKAGIEVRFQHFQHPVYFQGEGRTEFVPALSALDYVMWNGRVWPGSPASIWEMVDDA